MATVLTLAGFGWQNSDIMASLYQGWAAKTGNEYHRVDYTPEHDGVFANGVGNLDWAIENTGSFPKVVLTHSLGSQVAGKWLNTYGVSKAAHASDVSFTLCANPDRKYGHALWPCNGSSVMVPDTTAFTVRDVARAGDGWCNWPRGDNVFNTDGYNLFKIAEAIIGMFTTHLMYFDVDLDNLAGTCEASEVVGNTTYYVMP